MLKGLLGIRRTRSAQPLDKGDAFWMTVIVVIFAGLEALAFEYWTPYFVYAWSGLGGVALAMDLWLFKGKTLISQAVGVAISPLYFAAIVISWRRALRDRPALSIK